MTSFVRLSFLVGVLSLSQLACGQNLLRGDCNGDGLRDGDDISYLVHLLCQGTMVQTSEYDFNGDGRFGVGDVCALASFLNSGCHEWVELGLSVCWATTNLGATDASDVGGWYAWGEIQTKESFCPVDYIYYVHDMYQRLGVDISATPYDAAMAQWGEGWRMPTLSETNELLKRCTWIVTTQDDVTGYRVFGPNGNSIFLPMSGVYANTNLLYVGSGMYYWTSTTPFDDSASAYCLNNSSYTGLWESNRCYGMQIRAVRVK